MNEDSLIEANINKKLVNEYFDDTKKIFDQRTSLLLEKHSKLFGYTKPNLIEVYKTKIETFAQSMDQIEY